MTCASRHLKCAKREPYPGEGAKVLVPRSCITSLAPALLVGCDLDKGAFLSITIADPPASPKLDAAVEILGKSMPV